MNSNYKQILNRASAICSRSEKCRAEITLILEKADLSSDEVDQALEYLVEEGFINEERYAANFVHDKFYLNKWGKYKIAYMLRMKKIPEETISMSLSQISSEQYEETLRALLCRKAKSIQEIPAIEQKSKLIAFALGRGYESDLAFRLANEISIQRTGNG